MFRYFVQRLLVMVPTLIVISIAVFAIIQAPPGASLAYTTNIAKQVEGVLYQVPEAQGAFVRLKTPIAFIVLALSRMLIAQLAKGEGQRT